MAQSESAVTRNIKVCDALVNKFGAREIKTLSKSESEYFNTSIVKMRESFTALEGAFCLVDVWTEEESLKETLILEEFGKKVMELNLSFCSLDSESPGVSSVPPKGLLRVNESLKPPRLLMESSLAEFRSWKQGFDCFYKSNNMDTIEISEQRGYLHTCLDLLLQQLLSTKVHNHTPIFGEDGCIEEIRNIFLRRTPMIKRRYNFFNCNQNPGETFSEWYLRLQLEGQEAELENINVDYLYTLRIITGIEDKQLREEFLRKEEPTREELVRIATSWESAECVRDTLDGRGISVNKLSTYKKNKGHNFTKSDVHKSNKSQSSLCFSCGESDHIRPSCPFRNNTCTICLRIGHIHSICHRLKTNNPESNPQTSKRYSNSRSIHISGIYVNNTWSSNHSTPRVSLRIYPNEGRAFHMNALPDTGAHESLISKDLVDRYGLKINTTDLVNIRAANKTGLACYGSTQFIIPSKKIWKRRHELLVSWHALIGLEIISKDFPRLQKHQVVSKVRGVQFTDICNVQKLAKEFPKVFNSSDNLLPMQGQPMKIHLKEKLIIKPVHISTPRTVPLAYREKLKKELDYMVRSKIIEPVDIPTEWVSPSLVVPKADGSSIRLVVDYTGLNKFVSRPEHPFPSPNELSSLIPPSSKFFATLDAIKGYWQIQLDEKSSYLTTFLTPFGRFRYCRAPMGLNASGDEFCRRIDEALHGLPGILKIVDDILIFAETEHQLTQRLRCVLERCLTHNITLSLPKAKSGTSVKFAGFIVSSNGIAPDPTKTEAISKFVTPTNKTDLRSFMGLTNQLGSFVPDLAHITEPLRQLLKQNNDFVWSYEHENAFKEVKKILTLPDGPVLSHFDPKLSTTLLTDASRLKGLGFALVQSHPDGTSKLVQCGSRFINETESRYATCELEALAIQWAVKKCKIFNRHFFYRIFDGRNLDAVDNARLQRIMEKLAGYTFDIKWTSGKTNLISDALSRNPVFDPPEQCDISVANFSVTHIDPALQPIIKAAKEDGDYQILKSTLMNDISLKNLPVCHPSKAYAKIWSNLSIDELSGLLLLNANRIIVPVPFRRTILTKLHSSHQGIRRAREMARALYYWPGMNNDILNIVNSCSKCIEYKPSQPQEPLQSTNSSRPLSSISVDLFQCTGKNYIVVVDRFTGWPSVSPLRRTSTEGIITVIYDWCLEFGFPDTIRTDGGPQFRSQFKKFCEDNNIIHELTSPYHSQSNGHAESYVKSMKHLLLKSESWRTFKESLLEWRNIPRDNGLSPAQWLFGRRLRTSIPATSSAYERITEKTFSEARYKKEKIKDLSTLHYNKKCKKLPRLNVGDDVVLQDPRSKRWESRGRISGVRGSGRSFVIRTDRGDLVRNRRFIRKNAEH
ncbi:Uncharacterized protein FKW44_015903 [Caligus rogercresseyi]|uniref:RNA-directed DNA polymerase n=2 Tax=Caligus rogercresseyi TaxID=217165 RepID=A0A7T8K010_CALRO|nr:Uncharacterized protein FKW44_015903 [Caligus rogercresseyi]